MERTRWSAPRHRPHQWCFVTPTRLLQESPVHVELVGEQGTSSIDPFSGKRVRRLPDDPRCGEEGHRYVNVEATSHASDLAL